MARTRLFARLRTLLAREKSRLSEAPRAPSGLTRRDFVQRSLLGLAALGQLPALAACSNDDDRKSGRSDRASSKNARVVIVGGGMAGLTCAFRLKQAGIEATVYEASRRTGGRMFSSSEGFLDGQVGELGGEFIDTGHLTMHTLADELSIQLDDREELLAGVEGEVWWVEGRAVPEATIVEQFKRVAPTIAELVEQADDEQDDSVFVALDNTSLADWLNDNLTGKPELKSVLNNAYRGEYGRETSEQSALNLIYLIGADEPEPFRIFGDSDERFHTHLGNQTFPDTLAAELDGQIELDHKLIKASGDQRAGYVLTFEREGGEHEVEADHVVFALPFTTLRKVDLTELTLSDDKRTVIEELGYGTNAKVLGAFQRRTWNVEHARTGSVTSDETFQQVWDSAVGQSGDAGVLTNFLGGEAGANLDASDADGWFQRTLLPAVEAIFPGTSADYAGFAVAMHWPTHPHTLGSYGCYEPGQWAFYGTEGLPENDDTLHFCGEHTSLEFQGYMEGAADTGSLVAGAVLDVLGVAPAEKHAGLLRVRRRVRQPFFAERVDPRAYRKRRLALHDAALALLEAGRGR